MSEQSYHVPEWTPADRFRKARLDAGLTQDELADRIGVTGNTIGNHETGSTTNYRRIVVRQWAMACGVPAQWIITGIDPDQQVIPPTKWFAATA